MLHFFTLSTLGWVLEVQMVDLSCAREVKVVESDIGKTVPDGVHDAGLNDLLADGWRALRFATDRKVMLGVDQVVTRHYYILGR